MPENTDNNKVAPRSGARPRGRGERGERGRGENEQVHLTIPTWQWDVAEAQARISGGTRNGVLCAWIFEIICTKYPEAVPKVL